MVRETIGRAIAIGFCLFVVLTPNPASAQTLITGEQQYINLDLKPEGWVSNLLFTETLGTVVVRRIGKDVEVLHKDNVWKKLGSNGNSLTDGVGNPSFVNASIDDDENIYVLVDCPNDHRRISRVGKAFLYKYEVDSDSWSQLRDWETDKETPGELMSFRNFNGNLILESRIPVNGKAQYRTRFSIFRDQEWKERFARLFVGNGASLASKRILDSRGCKRKRHNYIQSSSVYIS